MIKISFSFSYYGNTWVLFAGLMYQLSIKLQMYGHSVLGPASSSMFYQIFPECSRVTAVFWKSQLIPKTMDLFLLME